MTNSKNTKRALLASILSVMLCCAMLIGSTFAWFTDSDSTAVNKIQAGTLDVALEMKDASGSWVTAEGQTLNWKKAAGAPAGEAVLWEPGCTYELPELRIRNNGSLALKYKLVVTGIVGDAKLLEAIDFTYGNGIDLNAEVPLAPNASTEGIIIKGHMKETAGNEYQGLSIDGIGITVVATQDTVEYDSFDNQYDGNAEYPVANLAEMKKALTNAQPGETIALTADIASNENLSVPEGVVLDGLGNTLITEARVYASNGATLRNITFEKPVNANKNASFIYASSLANELVVENCTFVDTQWDAIQVTPVEGANVVIRNNVFKTTENIVSTNNGKCERYIHVEATGANMGAKFTVTITGNTFENIDKCRNSVIDIDYIASKADITAGYNSFSGKEVTESNLGDVLFIIVGKSYSQNDATMANYNAFVANEITALN